MPLPSVFQGVQDCRLPGLKLLFFKGFKTAVCLASNPPDASAGLQGNNSYSYMPLPSVFQGVQDCRLPGLKPSKRFRRPPRQQLLQLHAPAICFSGGSRLPFARPQTPQTLPTLPQASKATTLTATCPCHLFFRGFKTAACPASNPPYPSAALQGNNCCSYMPLPSVFQGVHGLQEPVIHRLLWGFLLWHEPFCFLAWFPSRRVMVDVNLPKRTAWPHNSLTHRARVGMAPRLSADTALLWSIRPVLVFLDVSPLQNGHMYT